MYKVRNAGKNKDWTIDMKALILNPQEAKPTETTHQNKQQASKLRMIHEKLLDIVADIMFTHDPSMNLFLNIELTKDEFTKIVEIKTIGWLGTTCNPFKLVSKKHYHYFI